MLNKTMPLKRDSANWSLGSAGTVGQRAVHGYASNYSNANRLDSRAHQAADSAAMAQGLSPLFQRSLALLALLLLSPLLLCLVALIRLESPGRAVFLQQRVGLNGRRFSFYKFRSMRIASDPRYVDITALASDREGVCKKFRQDPRVTTIGRFIRKFSIDELPQLINVVKGDMLLVGPRPALVGEVDAYDYEVRARLQTMPGLTGLWQVSGRADTSFEQQVELDLRYIENKSFWQDVSIIFATIPAVLGAKGAY